MNLGAMQSREGLEPGTLAGDKAWYILWDSV